MIKLSLLASLAIGSLALPSCSKPQAKNDEAPIYFTPFNDKVDLSQISMTVSNLTISKKSNTQNSISFDYTINNQSGHSTAFACLYNRSNSLIEVNITDEEGNAIPLAKGVLDNLTLAKPKPMVIKAGETTNTYTKLIASENSTLETGSIVNVRIRLHTPSRYDELRSSLEAPITPAIWP